MRIVLVSLLFAFGCSQPTNTAGTAATAQQYINGWDRMGMWLPDQNQVAFFHSNFAESQESLVSALGNRSYEIRMRGAYVVGKIGPDAQSVGPALVKSLEHESDRLVRLYFYQALREIRFAEPRLIADLKERFASLDEVNEVPQPGQSNSKYTDADEKIRLAAALYFLDQGADRKQHLDFILKWLRPPEEQQTAKQRTALWERRWGAVLALENMPNAADAVPLLDALQNEKDAPPWVSVHVPRVLESLQ